MARRWNPQHRDAIRAGHKFRLELVTANIGHCWVTREVASQRPVEAVIAANPLANPEKVWEMVRGLWECKS